MKSEKLIQLDNQRKYQFHVLIKIENGITFNKLYDEMFKKHFKRD